MTNDIFHPRSPASLRCEDATVCNPPRVTYKYQTALAEIPNCPASEFSPRELEAYRYVFASDVDGSFLPPWAKNPKRALKFDDLERCNGWALSFFGSAGAALQAFDSLRRTIPQIKKSVGDSLAGGAVTEGDGVCSEMDAQEHFDLHEFADANWGARFVVVEPLP